MANLSDYSYDKISGVISRNGKPVGSFTRKYGRTCINGKDVKLARLAFYLAEGWWPIEVDHINGDTHDNRWSNLRACTKDQNAKNRRAYKNNTSGFKGVSKADNSYKAEIQVDNVRLYLGVFKTPEEAAIAYNKAAREHHGEFATLNIVE